MFTIKDATYIGCLLALLSIIFSSKLWAADGTEFSDAEDPRFVLAVQAWLADNDADSLPVLSSLAHNNNTAARLLLARIEVTDRSPSLYLRSLSRQEWRRLFRAPSENTIFLPGWANVESNNGNELARLLVGATAPGIDINLVRDLFEAGEIESAEHRIRKVSVDGTNSQRNELLDLLQPKHELRPYLTAFLYAEDGLTTGRTGLNWMLGKAIDQIEATESSQGKRELANARTFIDIGYQAGDQMPENWYRNKYYEKIGKWVMTNSTAAPLANLCQNACASAERLACATTAFGLVGGYYEVIRFDSPLESVIPQSEFYKSPRAQGMVVRRIISTRTEVGDAIFTPQQFREQSRCLAEFVQARGLNQEIE